MKWQPIETAPISHIEQGDWSEVLVWNTEYGRCDICRIDADKNAMWGDWDIAVKASHWMPLPEQPEAE
jgi:hypothetical protein